MNDTIQNPAIRPTIWYVVIAGEIKGLMTPFQQYDFGMEKAYQGLSIALSLPPTATQAFLHPMLRILRRIHDSDGRHHILIIRHQDLESIRLPQNEFPFVVFISTEKDMEKARLICDQQKIDGIVICSEAENLRKALQTIEPILNKYILERAVRLNMTIDRVETVKQDFQLDDSIVDSTITAANEIVIRSVGFDPQVLTLEDLASRKEHKNSSLETLLAFSAFDSADLVTHIRSQLIPPTDTRESVPPGVSLLLAAQSPTPEFYTEKSERLAAKSPILKSALKILRAQRGYAMQSKPEDLVPMSETQKYDVGNFLQTIVPIEVQLFSIGVAAIASRHFTPVVRLAQLGQEPFALAQRLARSVRDTSDGIRDLSSSSKIPYLVNELSSTLQQRLPQYSIDWLKQLQSHVKIVGHAPLEFTEFDGLPLMLKHSTSRVPSTPGDTFLHVALRPQLVNYHVQDISEVLVLRCFDPKETLSLKALENQINFMLQSNPDEMLRAAIKNPQREDNTAFKVKFVDVQSETEVIDALNAYNGNILVFDCHGGFDRSRRCGVLRIGEGINTWQLFDRARIPAIVLLSACDTIALDDNYASVASGLLFSGAIAVLATAFPVGVTQSAAWISNLLYYSCRFFPRVYEASGMVARWSDLVTWTQRVAYCQEIMTQKKSPVRRLGDKTITQTILSQLLGISRYSQDWVELVSEALASVANVKKEILVSYIKSSWLKIPEAVRYLQIGFPENILINAP